jgi:ribonuclease P/MRP protein subunit POP5
MVRLKQRYLIVDYLYPAATGPSNSKDHLPAGLQFHQPTPDEFHQGKLIGAIREGVAELFGDYGMGMVSTSLKSKTPSIYLLRTRPRIRSSTDTDQ